MLRILPPLLALVALTATSVFGAETVPHWIWSANQEAKSAYFRFEFEVPQNLKSALVSSTADDSHQLFVNGQRVGRGESWGTLTTELITDQLTPGKKAVVSVKADNKDGAAGFIAQLTLEDTEGKKTVYTTDESWLASGKAEQGWQEAAFKPENTKWVAATKLNAAGTSPRETITPEMLSAANLRIPEATPVDRITVKEGFKVELLYSVPKATQGSWVAMTVDDAGRLLVSDQYGGLYRVKTPAPGKAIAAADVERIPVDLGGAQGLLWAHHSLYAVLNTNEHGGRGLYRVRDTNGDDVLDSVKLLKKFEEQGGEHGPHAVLLGPDKESIYVVCGNQTALPEGYSSRVPPVWQEDQILPRVYGRGFMRGVEAPRGWIAKTDPDGVDWEIIATGFRNEYDADFNREGELFAYDADMEWDMNTPWYRPTRVNHVISGAEFGWRNGSAKWPEYYSDSFGAVVNIGPGSPTGVAFGYGAKFPAKYQDAFFICDWSYGKMYAVHMKPEGASYTAEFEEFVAAQPLPLTDLLVHPKDGALYFAIGGRRVQSGLYRVTYTGKESTKPSEGLKGGEEARKIRHQLESWHKVQSPVAITEAWPYLGSEDRALRYAARVAIEHQPVDHWVGLAVSEKDPQARLAALIALARVGGGREGVLDLLLSSLSTLDYAKLNHQQRLDLLRGYSLAIIRHGGGYPNTLTEAQTDLIVNHLEPFFPAKTREENTEMTQLFTNLDAEFVPERGVALLLEAPSQEEQIVYAKNIRLAKRGWTPELREEYFQWFVRAQTFRGGASFENFVASIKTDAVALLTEAEKKTLEPVLMAKAESEGPQFAVKPRQFVKNWTMEDFADVINVGLEGNRDFASGRNAFGTVGCYACHRFNQDGGAIGPDLTSVSGKFSPWDLLESIVNPSKEISDQYGAMVFEMNDGSTVIGRIMNLSGDSVRVSTNMYDPNAITMVDRKRLKEMRPSPVSMMPPGLINVLEKDEVLDLLAYLLSKGNPDDPMFK